jgi:hypothetical protein
MKNLNFTQWTLNSNELKTIKAGNGIIVINTTYQLTDFNSSRSNRQRGN